MEAVRCGLREVKEVVFLGDGAGWIRKNDVSILVVPRLSSIGITPWNTSGIAAKFFSAKVVKLRKNGLRNVKVGSGMDRHGNC